MEKGKTSNTPMKVIIKWQDTYHFGLNKTRTESNYLDSSLTLSLTERYNIIASAIISCLLLRVSNASVRTYSHREVSTRALKRTISFERVPTGLSNIGVISRGHYHLLNANTLMAMKYAVSVKTCQRQNTVTIVMKLLITDKKLEQHFK